MFRLKTRAQFEAVLAQRVIARSEHFSLHRHPLTDQAELAASGSKATQAPGAQPLLFSPSGLWLGAMVPKRWARRSVTRHAIKRQIYAVSQTLLPPHDCAAYLVRLRRDFPRQQFPSGSSELLKRTVREELMGLMERLAAPAAATPGAPLTAP